MEEDLRITLLRAVSDSIGLLVDKDAIVPSAGPRRQFDSSWKSTDERGYVRIKPSSAHRVFATGGSSRFRRHTGILLKGTSDPGSPVYMATAAHCVVLGKTDDLRLVVDREDMAQDFDERHVLELDRLNHFEEMFDRDLAIFTVKGSGAGLKPMRMPKDSLAPEVRDGKAEIYVIGHDGGRRLDVVPARVTSPVGPKEKPRGLNIKAPGARCCLSGAPVFEWSSERGASILGVVQGNKSIEWHFYELLRGYVGGDEKELRRILNDVHDAVLYAELLHRHGGGDARVAAAFRRRCDECEAPELGIDLGGKAAGARIGAEAAMEKIRTLLGRRLQEYQIRELEDSIMDPDQCDAIPPHDTLNVTLIQGGASLALAGGP